MKSTAWFGKAALAAIGLVLVPGCGGDAGTGGGAPPAGAINLFAWSEYVPEAVIDGFTEATGIAVHYETFASNEEMLGKLLAGGTAYDLIQPSEYATEALVRHGKLEKLDPARIPNLAHVGPEFRNLPHDPELAWSAPYMAGTVGIVVNTDRVKAEVRGFSDVFTAAHRGRIVVVNDNREIVAWALATLGLPINDFSPGNLEKAEPLLAEWLKLVKVFDSDSPKTALLNGDVDLGVVWSGEAAILWKEDRKFRFVLPAEGTHLFVDNLAIPAGARNREAALRFIDWCLRPEVGRLISEKFPYTNPNLAARKLLAPDELGNPASYPRLEGLRTFRDIGAAAKDVDRLMTRLRAGL